MYTQNENESQGTPEGFIRLPEILKLIPISKSAWWIGIQRGQYPKSVKLGLRTTAWRRKDIFNLMQRIESGEK